MEKVDGSFIQIHFIISVVFKRVLMFFIFGEAIAEISWRTKMVLICYTYIEN